MNSRRIYRWRRVNADRPPRGATTVELVCGLILLVPIALLMVDIGFMITVMFLTDAACREAVRAAAQQQCLSDAALVAQSTINFFGMAIPLMNENSFLGGGHIDISKDSADSAVDVPNLLNKDSNGTVVDKSSAPFARINCTVQLKLPAPLLFSAEGFTNKVTLKSSYTFPLLNGVDPTGGGDIDDDAPDDEDSASAADDETASTDDGDAEVPDDGG